MVNGDSYHVPRFGALAELMANEVERVREDLASTNRLLAQLSERGLRQLAAMKIALPILIDNQYSRTAHGGYGSTARACRECGGLHPHDALNNGGGDYTRGEGHKAGCKFVAVIQAVEECL